MQAWGKGCLEQRTRHPLQDLGGQNASPTLSGIGSKLEFPRMEQGKLMLSISLKLIGSRKSTGLYCPDGPDFWYAGSEEL